MEEDFVQETIHIGSVRRRSLPLSYGTPSDILLQMLEGYGLSHIPLDETEAGIEDLEAVQRLVLSVIRSGVLGACGPNDPGVLLLNAFVSRLEALGPEHWVRCLDAFTSETAPLVAWVSRCLLGGADYLTISDAPHC